MAKMFVHYNGTVEAFKAAGLETTYNKHIVFIKGGADGTGQAIYTHGEYYGNLNEALAALEAKVNGLKYFSQITDGINTAKSAIADGTITFSAVDPALVTVEVGARGVSFGLSDAFVKKVNEDLPDAINTEKSRAEGVEAKIKALVGTKKDQAATGDDASAFARIANLESAVSDLTGGSVESVGAQITNAINNLNVTKVEGDYIKSIELINGKIVAAPGTFEDWATNEEVTTAVSGLETTINGKLDNKADKTALEEEISRATSAESTLSTAINDKVSTETFTAKVAELEGADATTLLSAKSYADGLFGADSNFAALVSRVDANEDAIEVLNGEGAGSVKKQVADAVASVVASAPEDFDTLKEVADWIASDTTGAAKMQADIAKLNGADTVEGSVAKQIKDAKTDITNIITENEETTAQAYSELNDRVGALEEQSSLVDSALQASDITTGSANGTIAVKEIDVKVKGLGSAAYTEANAYATAALGTLAEAAAPQATTYTKAEVDGMWNWEEL